MDDGSDRWHGVHVVLLPSLGSLQLSTLRTEIEALGASVHLNDVPRMDPRQSDGLTVSDLPWKESDSKGPLVGVVGSGRRDLPPWCQQVMEGSVLDMLYANVKNAKDAPKRKRDNEEEKTAGASDTPPPTPCKKKPPAVLHPLFSGGVPTTGDYIRLGGGSVMALVSGPGESRARVAAFDLDGTLITVNGTHKWPKSRGDWKFLSGSVPAAIRKMHDEDGMRIVIVSNQLGINDQAKGGTASAIAKREQRRKDFLGKLVDVSKRLQVPLVAFAATRDDLNRKPRTGIWEMLKTDPRFNGCADIDTAGSFYVGDAAGRKGDFSCGDRKFALNLGIPFLTPEAAFGTGPPDASFTIDFDPNQWADMPKQPSDTGGVSGLARVSPVPGSSNYKAGSPVYTEGSQELLVISSPPGIGKSTFCEAVLRPRGYAIVNQDTLKTGAKCVAEAKRALAEGLPVALDNTSPTAATRSSYVQLAKSLGVQRVRCLVFQGAFENDMALARHMNTHRSLHSGGRYVEGIAYRVFKGKYQEPDAKNEGFAEIVTVPFSPRFADERDEKLFRMHLLP